MIKNMTSISGEIYQKMSNLATKEMIYSSIVSINGQNKRNTQISIAPIRIFLH